MLSKVFLMRKRLVIIIIIFFLLKYIDSNFVGTPVNNGFFTMLALLMSLICFI